MGGFVRGSADEIWEVQRENPPTSHRGVAGGHPAHQATRMKLSGGEVLLPLVVAAFHFTICTIEAAL